LYLNVINEQKQVFDLFTKRNILCF